ncbi:MAG: aminotransferase class V-fold PLP-dependent enzyme [Planctomycetaceae bacterium]|nr:aminotransferase class V-fold PLP-dependent enzyme [Planctomycetaceae bacterium]
MTSPVSTRRYLDNAATSWPKPDAVYAAVDAYQRECGVAVGRGATRIATGLAITVDRCRQRAARLLGAESANRVVFTFNGTDGLNLALNGLLQPGDRVVTSVAEHNSVLRPLWAQREFGGVEVEYAPLDDQGIVDRDVLRELVTPETTLVVLTHASNVTGTIQPIEDAGEIAHSVGALLLVDAAQTAGHVPIDVSSLPVDILACSGHKGLLGPLGTGLLYLCPGMEELVFPMRLGGTGSQSETDEQPSTMPDRYESGNHNAPGIAGLDAALVWIEEQGIDALHQQSGALTDQLIEGLRTIDGVQMYGTSTPAERVGVVSLNIDSIAPQEVATILDQNFGIEVRAGFHCAPLIHKCLGTDSLGGTVRMSVGPFNTTDDIEAAVSAIREIAEAMRTV